MPLVVSFPQNSSSFAAQQRFINELIQGILLKRTELLCEQDKLQTRRDFLTSSLNELIRAVDNQRVGSWTCAPDSGFDFLDSGILVEPIQGTASFERTFFPTTTAADIYDLFDYYKNDCIRLEEQETAFKSLTRDLSNLEYRLQGALEAFRTSIQCMPCGLGEEDIADTFPGSAFSVATTEPSEHMAPLLEEYYSSSGSVGIHLERLQELDFHYEEGLIERRFLREQGHALDITDDEFDDNYRNRRHTIEKDLNAAQGDVETLAERCRDAGINISDMANDSSDSVSVESVSEFQVIDACSLTNQEPTPHPSRTTQLVQWVQNVVGGHDDS